MNTIVLFYPRVPNYLQKVGQHTQKISRRNGGGGYSSCHYALRKAAAQSLRSAGLPQFCANYVIRPKDFYFFISFRLSSSGELRTRAQGSRRSHGTICIAPPIIPENLFLHAYTGSLKKPTTICGQQRGQLDLIKGKAKYEMHLSSR